MSQSDRLQRLATPSAPAEDDVDADGTTFRDIHPSPAPAPLRQPSWDVASQRSLSSYSDEQFMASMSREFTAMVDAGGPPTNPGPGDSSNDLQLARIGEHEPALETNPLAIVADTGRPLPRAAASATACAAEEVVEWRCSMLRRMRRRRRWRRGRRRRWPRSTTSSSGRRWSLTAGRVSRSTRQPPTSTRSRGSWRRRVPRRRKRRRTRWRGHGGKRRRSGRRRRRCAGPRRPRSWSSPTS